MSNAKSKSATPKTNIKKMHNITLTKEQYHALLKIVYLGNWLANAIHDDTPEDKRLNEYDQIESIIFSYAKQFGYEQYVDTKPSKDGKYYPTRKLEEEPQVIDIINQYNESTFWDEFVEHLAYRDFNNHYNRAQIRKMSQIERVDTIYKYIDKWADEVNTNGLNNIGIVDNQ